MSVNQKQTMKYKETKSVLVHDPLWWQALGLLQTATGYGNKLTTPYKVAHNGRMYRVYCVCHSNTGTLYILPKGEPLYLADSNTLVLEAMERETVAAKVVPFRW